MPKSSYPFLYVCILHVHILYVHAGLCMCISIPVCLNFYTYCLCSLSYGHSSMLIHIFSFLSPGTCPLNPSAVRMSIPDAYAFLCPLISIAISMHLNVLLSQISLCHQHHSLNFSVSCSQRNIWSEPIVRIVCQEITEVVFCC
jgi:hypothetical protein